MYMRRLLLELPVDGTIYNYKWNSAAGDLKRVQSTYVVASCNVNNVATYINIITGNADVSNVPSGSIVFVLIR